MYLFSLTSLTEFLGLSKIAINAGEKTPWRSIP